MIQEPKGAESKMEILRLGQATEFWRVICDAIDESISYLRAEEDGDAIRELPAEQYKLESELLKAKRKYLAHLKNLPSSLIAYLTEPAENTTKEKNYDPFYSEAELKAEHSKEDEA